MVNIEEIRNNLKEALIKQAEEIRGNSEISYEDRVAYIEEIAEYMQYINAYKQKEKDKPKIIYLEEMER